VVVDAIRQNDANMWCGTLAGIYYRCQCAISGPLVNTPRLRALCGSHVPTAFFLAQTWRAGATCHLMAGGLPRAPARTANWRGGRAGAQAPSEKKEN